MGLRGPPLFWGVLGRGCGELDWQDLSQLRVIFHTGHRAEKSRPLLTSVVQGPLLWKTTPSPNLLSKQRDPVASQPGKNRES